MLRVVLSRNSVFGKYKVLLEYSKICLKYITLVLVLSKKIDRVVIFHNNINILSPFSLIHSFEELFIYDTYFLRLKSIKPLIIDCGANIGLSILYFRLLYPESNIIAIEPDPNTFSVLKQNTESNIILKNIRCINVAIMDNSKKRVSFYIDSDEPGSLQMSTLYNRKTGKEMITVETTTLSSIINKLKSKIDLIKIDVEGVETKVLAEIANHEINKVNQFIVEYHHHINPTEANFSAILNIFETSNFNYQISTSKIHLPFKRDCFEDILIWAYKNSNSN